MSILRTKTFLLFIVSILMPRASLLDNDKLFFAIFCHAPGPIRNGLAPT